MTTEMTSSFKKHGLKLITLGKYTSDDESRQFVHNQDLNKDLTSWMYEKEFN